MTQMTRIERPEGPPAVGEVVRQKLLVERNLTQSYVARAIDISKPRLNMILSGRCQVSAEIALRIERVFGISANFLLRARTEFELFRETKRISSEIHSLRQLSAANLSRASAWQVSEWHLEA